MNIYNIIESSGTGKSRRLMEEAYRNNGIFVCQNALHMREKANAYGLSGLKIVSFDEFINDIMPHPSFSSEVLVTGYKDEEGRGIYIDELEGFTNFICLNKFKGYTITKDTIR